jgi:hypothetical protein
MSGFTECLHFGLPRLLTLTVEGQLNKKYKGLCIKFVKGILYSSTSNTVCTGTKPR